jgi:hypothetical protein
VRWLLSRLGTRVGVALGLVLLIAAAIAIGKLAGDRVETPIARPDQRPLITIDPTTGDDGVVDLTPTSRPDSEAMDVATAFVKAWLRTDLSAEDWRTGVSRVATESLARNLAGVDPTTVPATRQTGQPTVRLQAPTYLRLAVPMDTGTLVLTVFKDDGEWLVGEVDWEQP